MKSLVKRHLLCYLRDRWAVFFSFLSVFIILGLFLIFLGNMQQASVPEALAGTYEADYLVYSWIFSGIVIVSTVTVPLGFLHIFIKDHVERKIDDFYIAPLKRQSIVYSYMLTAFIAGILLSVLNYGLTILILFLLSGYMIPLTNILLGLLILVFSNIVFTALFFFITTFLKTLNAHSNLATLVGTLIGFLSGLYVPIGSFSTTLQSILNSLPPSQIASLMRKVYMEDALNVVFTDQNQLQNYRAFFGVDLFIFDHELPSFVILIVLSFILVLMVGLSIYRLNHVSKRI